MELENIEQQITELKEELEQKIDELENYDETESYNEMLDDTTEHIFNMLPSTILEECDPIMYNEGLSNFEDEGRSELEDSISDLENDILDLEAIQDAKEEGENEVK